MFIGEEDYQTASDASLQTSTAEPLEERAMKRAKLVHTAGEDDTPAQFVQSKAVARSVLDFDHAGAQSGPHRAKKGSTSSRHHHEPRPGAEGTPGQHPLRPFSFEKLPPEVRTMIYGHLFAKDYTLRPLCREDRYFEERGTARQPGLDSAANLLRVSRLIYREASDVLYGQNDYLLYGVDFGDAVLAYLGTIGERNRRAIRNLQIDWQHGIVKINRASRAADLFSMVSDRNNPLRDHVRKMLHDVGRSTIKKFTGSLEMMTGSTRLEHLTIVCPGNENPGHPDNHCVEYHDCSGCHHEVPKVLVRMKGLKTLTVGDTDWHNELEVLAVAMEAEVLNVTQVDCIELPEETALDLEKQGWKVRTIWRVPDGEHFRRVVTKRLRTPDGNLLHENADQSTRQWW